MIGLAIKGIVVSCLIDLVYDRPLTSTSRTDKEEERSPE